MDFIYVQGLAYLVASGLFIFGLKMLSKPTTALTGNRLAALGMLIAIVVTLSPQMNWGLIIAGIVLGGLIGVLIAQKVQMTAMPQMVGIFNGLGGGASALVASAEFLKLMNEGKLIGGASSDGLITVVAILLSTFVGALTFSGSFIAFGKLQGFVTGKPILLPLQKAIDVVFLLGAVALAVFVATSGNVSVFLILIVVSLILGVLLVMSIGGADMPVVISLLNSYSGVAAAFTGFLLQNNALIISGALVGASGFILTSIMCKAMNRSLLNVMFGGVGGEAAAAGAVAGPEGRSVREVSAEDAAIVMANAQSVVITPGYGLAVAQAQHEVSELAKQLQARGVDVKYAIHPVAGRMPGHMNVLLAEANVPYEQLRDMDDINPEFDNTDVVLVIGANDVVNPAARHDKNSPIYGMPILDVDKARHVIINKRSMNPGFAGIENELFFADNTFMLFGDAKVTMAQLNREIKEA